MSTQEFPGDTQRPLAFRKPQRITITIPQSVYEFLTQKSAYEGRSLSNYASYLLEKSVKEK
jgi:predicted DNA binding CopG/RHH family protein